MMASVSRRGFLRGLTTLPLAGGRIALIGAPSAVAEPLTTALLDSYDAWLEFERRWLQRERTRQPPTNRLPYPYIWADGQPYDVTPCANAGANYHRSLDPAVQAPASSRAALVLSAVGCDWRGGGR